jgi:pimeloyl-ACP methyl ester carboxylesterase
LPHASLTKHRYDSGGLEYWLYEPDGPRPRSAPVIVFFHGWGGTNPAGYGAWLDHMVRRGNIVIYPRYQADLGTPFSEFTDNALAAVKNALERLRTEAGHVRPDLEKFAAAGHSVGGLLTANLAALAADSGLPRVRAIMSVQPAPTWTPLRLMNVPLADLAKIPSDTLLLAVVGDSDLLAGDRDAKRVFNESTKVPLANKDFITLISDPHGQPALNAGHLSPAAPDASFDNGEQRTPPANEPVGGPLRDRVRERRDNRTGGSGLPEADSRGRETGVNALDYYGLWKLFDALCDAAFYGRNRQFALGNTPQQRFMGKWSDGTAVKELRVTDQP